MSRFAELHVPGSPLLLPNAWDHASGAAFAAAGFAALGTTSLGVAAVLGLPDGANETKASTFSLAERLVHLPLHVSVDAENGFSTDPGEVADYAERLAVLGVAGINLEDQLADGHERVIAAVKSRAPSLFVNARTDTFWLGEGDVEATLDRAARYVAAGADGIFVPGVTDEATIALLAARIERPLNVLFSGTLPRLGELGVARVSTGSALFRVGLGAAVDAARGLRSGSAMPSAPSYAEVNDLAN